MTQVGGAINAALTKLRNAGAVLVPFDSSAFQELAVSAWPGASADTINNLDASSAYESIEVLGRSVHTYSTLLLSLQAAWHALLPQTCSV